MTTRIKESSFGIRTITVTALLAAVASVLMFINFALPLFPPFIKMDISDVPALIASFAIGPHAGVLVELIKNTINLTHSSTGGVGELANFSIGCAFVVPAGQLYRRNKTMRGAMIGLSAGLFCMTFVASVANYYVLIPLYSHFVPLEAILGMYRAINPYANTLLRAILMSVVPFNLLKGALASVLTLCVYKRLSQFIKN